MLGVPDSIIAKVPAEAFNSNGLLVYGSRARGDAVESSDLDLLALVSRPRSSITNELVSLSFYTTDEMHLGRGTLFGSHLRRDARILMDESGELSELVEEMGHVDTTRLFGRVHDMTRLFTNLDRDLPQYLPGMARLAKFLLRSAYYAKAIEQGSPCFSVRQLALRHKDADLEHLLSSRPVGEITSEDLMECLERLRWLFGEFPSNPSESLEATIVNEWDNDSDVLSMAFMALGRAGGDDYASMRKILL